MRSRLAAICLIGIVFVGNANDASAQNARRVVPNIPWSPNQPCKLNPANPQGLHPEAYMTLQKLSLAHRITQGINHSAETRNVHDTDGTINGAAYTGAVDISVRCLTSMQIQLLLGRLAEAGFAGWYRKDGQDDWTGPPHIHAVWAGCRLKPVLRRQVESWLNGGTGLGSDRNYRFWQASAEMKEFVRALYRKSN
jgi:hypothetical protein